MATPYLTKAKKTPAKGGPQREENKTLLLDIPVSG